MPFSHRLGTKIMITTLNIEVKVPIDMLRTYRDPTTCTHVKAEHACLCIGWKSIALVCPSSFIGGHSIGILYMWTLYKPKRGKLLPAVTPLHLLSLKGPTPPFLDRYIKPVLQDSLKDSLLLSIENSNRACQNFQNPCQYFSGTRRIPARTSKRYS